MWTPIPPITWVLPFVGHMGITDSRGQLHDWGGGPIKASPPSQMLFGEPARYLTLDPGKCGNPDVDWDAAVAKADTDYLQRVHCMICGSDCHSHVAHVLNTLQYRGSSWHNKVELAAGVFFFGRHAGFIGFLKTWLGFIIVLCVIFGVHFFNR